jgi:hypothetical protein
MKAYLPIFIIAGLLVYLFFVQECSRSLKPTILRADTVTVTITKEIPVNIYHSKPYPVRIVDSFVKQVDSAAIRANCINTWKDFNRSRVYYIPVINDSNGVLTLHGSVQFNELQEYSITGHYNAVRTTKTITNNIVPDKRNKVFLGATVASDLTSLSVFPTATLLTKREHIYSIGYNPFTKTGYAGIALKISFRRDQ